MASVAGADGGDMPPSKRRRTESISAPATHREMGIMRGRGAAGASFVGSASGIHFVRSVYNAVDTTSNGTDRQDLVPGEEDQLGPDGNPRSGEKLWRSAEIRVQAPGKITFDDLVRWSKSYFDHWHPMLPFLHAPSLLAWCEVLSDHPSGDLNSLSQHQQIILRAVLSISLADRRQSKASASSDAVPSVLVFESYDDAIASVQASLTAAPSTESLQAALCVQLFLISMLRHNAASRIGGIIIRLLFQMGMHRCPYRYTTFSLQARVLRQRIFWSVYCLDRQICQSLGIPLTLRDDDIDVCMLDDERHGSPSESGHEMDPRLSLLCLISKHSIIKGRVLELCNKSINHRRLGIDEVGRVRTTITKWANDKDNVLDQAQSGASTASPLPKMILEVLQNETVIALNRPLLSGGPGEDYDSALQACLAASRSIIKLLACDAASLIWPSLTWAAWMSGFITLYATVEGEMPLSTGLSLLDQCASSLDRLAARGTIWPSTCARVIRDLAQKVRKTTVSVHPERSQQCAIESVASGSLPLVPTLPENRQSGTMFEDTGFDPGIESIDLFRGFDIPFWLGDDQFLDFTAFDQD